MMKSKYKVGDIVTIKKVREGIDDDYRYSFTDLMVKRHGGKRYKIQDVYPARFSPTKIPDDGYVYTLEDTGWQWTSSMFEDSSASGIDAFIKRNKRPELDFTL